MYSYEMYSSSSEIISPVWKATRSGILIIRWLQISLKLNIYKTPCISYGLFEHCKCVNETAFATYKYTDHLSTRGLDDICSAVFLYWHMLLLFSRAMVILLRFSIILLNRNQSSAFFEKCKHTIY